MALAGALGLVAAGASSAFTFAAGPLLQGLLSGEGAAAGVGWARSTEQLAVGLVAIAGVRAGTMWLHTGLMQQVAQRVLATVRAELHAHVLGLPPAWHQAHHSGEVLARFALDVDKVELTVGQALTTMLRDLLQVVALLVACLLLDPRLFGLAFVVVPLMAWPVSRFAKALKKVMVGAQGSLGGLTRLVTEALQGLPVLQTAGAQGAVLAKADAEQARYLALMRRSLFVRGAFTPTLEVMGIAGVALALFVGVRAVQAEPWLAGKLLSFLAAALLVYQPVKGLSGAFGQLPVGLASVARLGEVLDAPVAPDEGEPCGPLRTALEFEGVGVVFADGRAGLDGVTLRISAGQMVALVGASGAGKSTLLRLLPRLLEPSSGVVRWDGVALSTLKPSSVRAQVAWLPQEAPLLSGTIGEVVRLWRPEASDDAVWAALEAAGAAAFVRERAGGLSSEVGERGSQLSGGQRQRLALARAYLAEASVLLLDEPTSALDAATQAEALAGLERLRVGRTVLIAAHRVETVRTADRVVRLEAGRVAQEGTPAEVLPRVAAGELIGV